ncbi:FAD-dependent monooxygenase [Amycolatopsis nigrescens]|uniref:FAD-dependent monooxygenase n=1 Tax=Amycolatopsis nigrescens TaxID=381445 RepID=UPI00035ECC10|nr:FAD-dependent monooxygenase [Amycolatopsis nigrescens]
MKHAAVIGGGIGGLSAAIGLRKAGWQVTVLERAIEPKPIGAGISLWPNALRALDELGVAAELAKLNVGQTVGGVRDSRGRWLSRWDATRFERLLGRPMLAVHRAELLEVLLAALPPETLRFGVEVQEVTEDGLVRWPGGELRADLVVGADGIQSGIRAALWPAHPAPVYSGSTAFRAVIEAPADQQLAGALGAGTEFGTVPLSGGRRYWFVSHRAPENTLHDDPKAFLRRLFGSWYEELREVIESTPAEVILQHDLYFLGTPLPSYVRGRVALLGDAAHAMPPFLGQGGCQAIEDAVVLAALAAQSENSTGTAHLLAEYDRQRRPRSQHVARSSVRTGRLGPQLRNPLAVGLRNTLLRAMPASLNIRAGAAAATWTPPRIAVGDQPPTNPAS